MRIPPIVDLEERQLNGELVYVEKSGLRGLGNPTVAQTNFVNATNTINNIVATADQMVPAVAAEYQSDFGKFTQKLAGVSAAAAGVAVAVPPPVGPIAAGVLGVVAGVATVLSKIFGNSKAKALAAERAQYEATIKQVLLDNEELDRRYNELYSAIENVKAQLKGYGVGLGLCIINCKKKKEEKKLDATKERYQELIAIQKNKFKLIDGLFGQYQQLLDGLLQVKQSSNINTYLLIGAIGLAVTAGGIVLYKSRNKAK